MNSRQRFRETMRYGSPDRVPYFQEGIRDEVLEVWRAQGLPAHADLSQMFPSDHRKEIVVDLEPRPKLQRWPTSRSQLNGLRRSLDPHDPERFPEEWPELVRDGRSRDYALMFRVHRGFFLSMGVRDWHRFQEVICLLIDDPGFVHEVMALQGEFAAELAERVLREVEVDAAVFSEPIGGNDRPLISPRMYEEKVPPLVAEGGYVPLADGRVREDVPFENYVCYRQLLEKVTQA